jgi:hypothetical protein
MTHNNTASRAPFGFVAGELTPRRSLAIVNGALKENEIRGYAKDLENRGFNLEALARRIEQGLDLTPVSTLLMHGYPIASLNTVLVGDTCTDDVNTGLYWMAENPAKALANLH